MDFSDIANLRINNQQISETRFTTSAELVSWLGAVQAQEYAQTKWALGLRLKHLNDNDIENDFNDGKILRTHLLRPTWHFVSPDDIRWILQLTAPRVNAINAYMYRQTELNKTTFQRCLNILTKILIGGKQLTRDAINAEFKKHKIIAKGHRLSYIMMYAELAGIICSGARHGNQFTYALLDERVKATNAITKDEALAELAKRYFASRGPATLKDFSTWSGLTLTECKQGTEMIKSFLSKESLAGNEYYFSSKISSIKQYHPSLYLLPVYDELIMGYKDRSAMLPDKEHLKHKPTFLYDNMIVFDGQIVGTWKRALGKNVMDIEFDFFRPLRKDHKKAFENAVRRLGEFTNVDVNYKKRK